MPRLIFPERRRCSPPPNQTNQRARACVPPAMPPTRSSTRAGGGLNLAALINPAPASTELPDDDFDPTGGALTRDGDGDSSDGDGFSDDDDALDRDDGVFRPTEDDERASGKGGRLRMRGGLSLDELGAEYQGKRTSRKAMEDAWAASGRDGDDVDDDDDDDDDDGTEEAGRGRPRANGTRGRR